MPTVKAPTNNTKPQVKKTEVQAPPKPMSSATPATERKAPNVAIILFIVASIILLGLLGTFMFRSTKTTNGKSSKFFSYTLDTPVLEELPEYTNTKKVQITGTSIKKAIITITAKDMELETKADKDGKFSAIVELEEEGTKYEFTAKASKKVLFWNGESALSNVVATTLDITAPNLKITKLPKEVGSKEILIKGSTSESTDITIKVNETEIKIEPNEENTFSEKIVLKEGENKITILAKDPAGNETATTNDIAYRKGAITPKSVSTTGNATLPDSAGVLTDALNVLFKRYFGIAVLLFAGIAYAASNGFVFLMKTYND